MAINRKQTMIRMNNLLQDVNTINEDLNTELVEQGKDLDQIQTILDDNYMNVQGVNTHLRET